MSRIITIGREFGSGGRELGKRLADQLGFDYYDREIITAIAERQGLDENYVEGTLSNHGWKLIPLNFRQSFVTPAVLQSGQIQLLLEQKQVIEGIAKLGKDCVIVGRNADVLLSAYEPLNIFVCADLEAKIQRCLERAPESEKLSRREIEQNIRRIDKNRIHTRELLSESVWGRRDAYHLILNTTSGTLRELAPAVAEFALRWFERTR